MTVINIIELTKTAPVVDIIFIVFLFLTVISFIGIIATPITHENIGIVCCVIMLLSVIGIFVCGALFDRCTVPNGKYQYEILIDDNVTFNEVTEKYNIIDQRGEIFVVEEKG